MQCVLVTHSAVCRFHWGMYSMSHSLCVHVHRAATLTPACAELSVEELAVTMCCRCWSTRHTLNFIYPSLSS